MIYDIYQKIEIIKIEIRTIFQFLFELTLVELT